MNLASVVRSAMAAAPASVKSRVTLTDRATGESTEATAIGVPTPGDRMGPGVTTGEATESMSLLPDGLAFPPAPGMVISRGAQTWTIVEAPTLRPDGVTPALYRLVVTR